MYFSLLFTHISSLEGTPWSVAASCRGVPNCGSRSNHLESITELGGQALPPGWLRTSAWRLGRAGHASSRPLPRPHFQRHGAFWGSEGASRAATQANEEVLQASTLSFSPRGFFSGAQSLQDWSPRPDPGGKAGGGAGLLGGPEAGLLAHGAACRRGGSKAPGVGDLQQGELGAGQAESAQPNGLLSRALGALQAPGGSPSTGGHTGSQAPCSACFFSSAGLCQALL